MGQDTVDRITFARRLIAVAVPKIKEQGNFNPCTARFPAHWNATFGPLKMTVTTGVLSYATDEHLSEYLDIWPTAGGPKLASIVWAPDRPWLPPKVVALRRRQLEHFQSWLAGA